MKAPPPSNGAPPPGQQPSDEDAPLTKAEASLLTKEVRAKLVDIKHEVELQMNDPKSPLYSVKSFEELRLYVFNVTLTLERKILLLMAKVTHI